MPASFFNGIINRGIHYDLPGKIVVEIVFQSFASLDSLLVS